jgi:uncharacterized protein (TIGR02001 family)
MKNFMIAAMALGVSAGVAQAQELSFGATLTTNYISRGATQSNNGVAFQPWVEIEQSGFYGGVWASNVDIGGETYEIDLYAGYRWESGATSFDIGYAHYFYDSGSAGGEVYGRVEHDAGAVRAFAGFHADPFGGLALTNVFAGVAGALPFAPEIEGSAQLGSASGGVTYGDIGLTYTLGNVDLDMRYHRGAGAGARVVFSTGVSF